MKRSPLKPGKSGLKRTSLKRVSGRATSSDEQRANQVAKKEAKAADRMVKADIREKVFQRDGHRCQLAHQWTGQACFGDLTFHHLQKASDGGDYTVENGLALCQGHNDWIEDHVPEARALGMVRDREGNVKEPKPDWLTGKKQIGEE